MNLLTFNINFENFFINIFKKKGKVKEQHFKQFSMKKIKSPKKLLSLHESHFIIVLIDSWVIKFDSLTLKNYNKSFIQIYPELYYHYTKIVDKMIKKDIDEYTRDYCINNENYKIYFKLLKYNGERFGLDIQKIKYSNIDI